MGSKVLFLTVDCFSSQSGNRWWGTTWSWMKGSLFPFVSSAISSRAPSNFTKRIALPSLLSLRESFRSMTPAPVLRSPCHNPWFITWYPLWLWNFIYNLRAQSLQHRQGLTQKFTRPYKKKGIDINYYSNDDCRCLIKKTPRVTIMIKCYDTDWQMEYWLTDWWTEDTLNSRQKN